MTKEEYTSAVEQLLTDFYKNKAKFMELGLCRVDPENSLLSDLRNLRNEIIVMQIYDFAIKTIEKYKKDYPDTLL